MERPVLYHLQISHYNEKVRWALDYKRVPHVRKAPMPLMHMAWAMAMTGAPTFPVLKLDGEAIGDSTRIIEALERRFPEPALYPSDPDERQRALELEDWFDGEFAPYLRRYLFFLAIEHLDNAGLTDLALGHAPQAMKTAVRAIMPATQPLLKLRYGIEPEGAAAARVKVEQGCDRLEAEIGSDGYLVGDRFTVADLAAAALFMPLVRPPEAPYIANDALPPAMAEYRDEMSKRPAWEWVRETYRRHRPATPGQPAQPAEPAVASG